MHHNERLNLRRLKGLNGPLKSGNPKNHEIYPQTNVEAHKNITNLVRILPGNPKGIFTTLFQNMARYLIVSVIT